MGVAILVMGYGGVVTHLTISSPSRTIQLHCILGGRGGVSTSLDWC